MPRCRSTEHDYMAVGFSEEGDDDENKFAYLVCSACGDYCTVGLRKRQRTPIPRSIRLAFPESADEPRA